MPQRKIVPLCILLTSICASAIGQTATRTTLLQRAAAEQAVREKVLAAQLERTAHEKNWPLRFKNRQGEWVVLTNIDANGYPIYTSTESNVAAAATIGTNKLWPGGGGGVGLSGAAAAVKGKLGVWDGGRARPTHAELTGRITNKETSAISDHTTHVAGTLMASGANPQARGMAFGLQELVVYDFTNNISEMLLESGNDMLISNHSYGTISGWYQNPAEGNRWEYRGQAGTNEDYKFGFYNQEAEIWDSIAYNAPYHLIVKSAGNNRNQNGPAVGSNFWRYNSSGQMVDGGNRQAGMSSNDGYDIIPTSGTAKNVLTVGAIEPIPSGYSRPQDAVLASFSSWGPTDDGRIKPDVVADGVNLYSSIGSSDNAYATLSGTSMAAPAAAGSLLLLQEHYAQLHGGTHMRSATLKALVIHTADEAGLAPGPDYKHGWGVMNMLKADQVLSGAHSGNAHRLIEASINNGGSQTYTVIASGKGLLTATLCWTDPRGIPHSIAINNPALKLVHDLDIRIKKATTTYFPWVLNPAFPDANAVTGDNTRDNVEKVEVRDVEPGATYTITVSHKGTLARGSQAFSVVVSGVGGNAYCSTSAPTTPNGARIDSVSFGGIRHLHPAGCAGYNNFKSVTGTIAPNTTVPLYVRLNACSGGPVDKIVKAWIDLNNDGDFTDAGELMATSGVINGDGVYTTDVAIPGNITPGEFGVLRLVVQETTNGNDVSPCGSYSKGETQDYRILFALPANDVGIAAIVSPLSTACAYSSQYVTIRLKNYGASARSNIVLSGTVMDGPNLVVNLAGTYSPALAPLSEVTYTFQTPFAAVAGKTYTITVKAEAPGDQYAANNELVASLVVNSAAAAPVPLAEICNDNTVSFIASNAGPDVLFWYESATANTPIAAGSPANSTVVRADKTYYAGRNDLSLIKVGPASKGTLGAGSYGSGFAGNFMKFTSNVPLTIEAVKLYTGNAGKVTITVADFVEFTTGGGYRFQPISSITLDVMASRPSPAAGDLPDHAGDAGLVYAVNLPVPEPGDHILILQVSEGATVFRNNGVTTNPSPYPFSIPGVVSFTGNSAGGNTDPNQFRSFYYFFYDCQVRLNGCASDNRVPVVATSAAVPFISLTGGTFTSSTETGNQWYLNNTPIGGATGKVYIATESGVYKTVVTTPAGCNQSSNELVYDGTGIDITNINLRLMPNPNNGRFTLDFIIRKKGDVGIRIVNMIGQQVYSERVPGFIGHYNQTVNAGRLPTGLYILQIVYDGRTYEQKLLVR